MSRAIAILLLVVGASAPAAADPCGMVPPPPPRSLIQAHPDMQGASIKRVGPQRTYAFFKDGVETIVIRPGFRGLVDNFGMLIPFPSVPSIRKVPDDTFAHILAAVAPPEVTIDMRPMKYIPPPPMSRSSRAGGGGGAEDERPLRVDEVRVLKQEAVGMYQIAVLEAGSPKALDRWMSDHGYQYPKGMDATVRDYVNDRWVFVAVRTRVGVKSRVSPRPGLKRADPRMAAGGTFDGHVQAMGFRFKVDTPVIPMRLSAFNEGKLYNEIYFLSDRGVKIAGLPSKLVDEQVPGPRLHRNVTDLLPLKIIGSPDDRETLRRLTLQQVRALRQSRDPSPHNGVARDLFASDLAAVQAGRLALKFEDRDKQLLNISERLNLRGKEIDLMHASALKGERERAVRRAERALRKMTLTVIKGELPRAFLAKNNLRLTRFQKKAKPNERLRRKRPTTPAVAARPRWGGYRVPALSWAPPVINREVAQRAAKLWPELKWLAKEELWTP